MKTMDEELMELISANVEGCCRPLDDALAVARHTSEQYGSNGIADLAPSEECGDGQEVLIAEGQALLKTALKALPGAAGYPDFPA